MLLNIKSLVVVLAMIGLVHWVFQKWMPDELVNRQLSKMLAVAWAGISAALFLSPDFWVFAFLAAVLIYWLGQRVHPAPLFAGLMFAAPYLEQLLPGIGGINQLMGISYPRLLGLMCLVLWVNHWKPKKAAEPHRSSLFDSALLVYGLFALALQLLSDSLTNSIRVYLYFLTDAMLVYWVGRSWAQDRRVMHDTVVAFIFGVMVTCMIAAFEFGKGWLLYANLADSLHAYGTTGRYLVRGETGLIRASATAGHSIPMGYIAMVGILLWMGCCDLKKVGTRAKAMGFAMLAAGSIASLSRGPWVALAAGLILWYSLSPQGLKRLAIAIGVIGVGFGLALLTPAREDIISLIPWVGTADSSNIDYRQRLIQVSLFLISESPWFGSPTFLSAPIMQQMIQGQGIIDLVNTYVALALSSGMVGVALFSTVVIGPFFRGMPLYLRLLNQARVHKQQDLADPMLRALLCVLLSSAIAIGTVSSITVIPWTYWLMAGLAVNLIQHHSGARRAAPARPVPPGTHV
jgi:O-Antigen ligase